MQNVTFNVAEVSMYATASAKQEILDSMDLLLHSNSMEEYNYLLSRMDEFAKAEFEKKVLSSEEIDQEKLKAMLSGVFENISKYKAMQCLD